MPTTARPQQRYDDRLRIWSNAKGTRPSLRLSGSPRSTARGWLLAAPTVVVSLEVADLTEAELRQEILKLPRRVEKLAPLLRLALPCYRPRVQVSGARLPDEEDKRRILRAWIRRGNECRCERFSGSCVCRPNRFQAWRRRQTAVRWRMSRPVLARHRID